jgi:hypothetical protein
MTPLAQTMCAENGWTFTETFRHQYLVTPKSEAPVSGWSTAVLGDWRISYCPGLPKTDLTLSNGTLVGIVLGYAISADGMMLDGSHKLPIASRIVHRMAAAETQIAQFAGRYVVLLAIEKDARLYPDPACALGPVYNAARRQAGASTTLVVDRPLIDNPDVPAEDAAGRTAFYRFGHTADAEVRRARSNHYLDLSDFTLHRHWPLPETELELGDASIADMADDIADKLALNMAALAGRYSTSLPVSGGTDSRLLLAASRDILHQINHFFVYQTNWSTSIDCILAREIAEKLCLSLQVVSRDSPFYDQVLQDHQFDQIRAQRRLRNGLEPDTADPRSIRAMELVPQNDLILRGNVGEMTRALRWLRHVFEDPHNSEYALGTISLSRDNVGKQYGFWEKQFLAWKATLPDSALPRIYDFVHTELWLPHTNSLVYMADTRDFMINPFNDRRLIASTMRVPAFARKRRRLVNKVVRTRMPEIAKVPYSVEYIRDLRNRQQEERAAS